MNDGPLVRFQHSIFLVRRLWVMLDSDLAEVYQVPTRRLNEQVQRNSKRFPPHYAFRLTREESRNLISQNATSRWGGRRKLPYVFTEYGAVMAANVLRSPRAIEKCAQVVEAFVTVSRAATVDRQILQRIHELERRTRAHGPQFQAVYAVLRKLLAEKPRGPLGFPPPSVKN